MGGEVQSDSELIAKSIERPDAFDEIFRRHFRDIYRFAARQLGEDDGEELAAETFARAFAERGRFNTEGSARPWLFGICSNVIHASRRTTGRRGRAYRRAYEPDIGEAADDAVDSALDAERQAVALRSAIDRLRPAQRQVFTLSALGGLSGSEIAEALALPAATVRSHLHRARRALRAQFPTDSGGTDGAVPLATRRHP